MQVKNVNNHPSFGLRAPKSVIKKLSNPGLHFLEAEDAIKHLHSIGSDEITLSSVKFTEKSVLKFKIFPDNYTVMDMIFKFKTPNTEGVVRTQQKSCCENSLYIALWKGQDEAACKYIVKKMLESAKKGKLGEVSEELKQSFPIGRDFIDRVAERIAAKKN